MATKYYNKQLKIGKDFEKFVVDVFADRCRIPLTITKTYREQIEIGETLEGYEIKLDTFYSKTGNLFIEIDEKSNPENANFITSGIFRQDNSKHYVIGDYNYIWVFWKHVLIKEFTLNVHRIAESGTKTSHGMLLPITRADNLFWMKINI